MCFNRSYHYRKIIRGHCGENSKDWINSLDVLSKYSILGGAAHPAICKGSVIFSFEWKVEQGRKMVLKCLHSE